MNSAEELVEHFESCELTAYLDLGRIWTIGWGHTGVEVTPGLVWTQSQADTELAHDLLESRTLARLYSPKLAGAAFEAIVDFIYNMGCGRYRTSTLRTYVNARQWDLARAEILKWDHDDGVEIKGLYERRQAEAEMLG